MNFDYYMYLLLIYSRLSLHVRYIQLLKGCFILHANEESVQIVDIDGCRNSPIGCYKP